MADNWAEGRIALVTGATSGFGEAMARRIVAAGGQVIATGRRAARLEALAKDLATDRLLTRELFYTAVTRAEEAVLVVGSEAAVRAAVDTTAQRATGLRQRLAGG